MATKKPKKSVSWAVCGCGCGGFTFSLGGEHYWLCQHLEAVTDEPTHKKGLILFQGHGYSGTYLGFFDNFTTADQFVVDKIRNSGILEKLERDLKRAKLLLK